MAQVIDITPGETALGFLPLAHVYARVAYFGALKSAATIYISSPKNLAEDLPRVRPITFCSVSCLYGGLLNGLKALLQRFAGKYERKYFSGLLE